jgi:uncharacterized protein
MKILMTGGTGFIGKALCRKLLQNEHELTIFSRRPESVPQLCGHTTRPIGSLDDLTTKEHFDAIINLAGEGIADARWTPARKKQLLDSRIKTTQKLITYINRVSYKPEVLISGSAVGFYGNQEDHELNEYSAAHDDFAHRLCAQWEAAAAAAEAHGIRVCILRTGLVIGDDGGFLKRMLPVFKLGMGGTLGNGKQWMPWIHRDDFIAIIELLLNAQQLKGVFNATAPNPVTNAEFTHCLANVLKRPAFLPVPAIVLKILLGEMAELLLGGQKALPHRLQQEHFSFKFTTLEQALKDVLS